MKCPECQSENPEGMKFCVECGKKLEIKCPKCGWLHLPDGEARSGGGLFHHGLMKGCGADGWVEKYEKELASIQ